MVMLLHGHATSMTYKTNADANTLVGHASSVTLATMVMLFHGHATSMTYKPQW
jgi:hypothetical protein